jgi:hypothetical protein
MLLDLASHFSSFAKRVNVSLSDRNRRVSTLYIGSLCELDFGIARASLTRQLFARARLALQGRINSHTSSPTLRVPAQVQSPRAQNPTG